jgi:tetratricopeptide (TPR) repeat protein/transcriptional regulator with XRE-family HTH domain
VFADLVRGHRYRLGLTQEELAARSGVAVRTIRSIEAGRIARPRAGTARSLADVFRLTGADRETFLRAALDDDPPPATVLREGAPAQLPADVVAFTGRDEELAILDKLVTPGRAPAVIISAVSGTAGVGKTALAVQWGHRVAERFPDGQLYLNLRGYDPEQPIAAADALARLLGALGVADADIPLDVDARAAAYRTRIAGQRMLIVLDNAAAVDQVRPLLPGSSACAVVITSRDRMAGLVARDGALRIDLDLLPADEAVALLRKLIGDRVDAEPHAAAALVERCARLPLALRVAAELAITRPTAALSHLVDELADQQQRLSLLDAGGDHRTAVTGVFSWSIRHLSADAARVFRLLGLHPGPDVSVAAAASLAGLGPTRARPVLTELVRANLLAEPTAGRFTLHDLLRDYAAELTRAEDSEADRRDAVTRLLDHYTHGAHAADRLMRPRRVPMELALTGPAPGSVLARLADPDQAMAWLTAEYPALLAAMRHAADAGLDTCAWQLAWALATFQDRRGHWHDRMAAAAIGLAAAQRLDHLAARAHAFRAAATASADLRRYDEAQSHLERALDLAARAGDPIAQAQTHRSLGHLHWRQGRLRECLHHSERALDLFREAAHPSGTANALNGLGWCYAELGEYEQALRHCEQGLAVLQDMGDTIGEAATWDSLGYINQGLGRPAEASDCYHRSIDLYRRLGDLYNEADTLSRLGEAQQAAGDVAGARVTWRRALNILTGLDHPDAPSLRAKLHQLSDDAR